MMPSSDESGIAPSANLRISMLVNVSVPSSPLPFKWVTVVTVSSPIPIMPIPPIV